VQVICLKFVFIIDNIIVRGPSRSFETLVRLKIKVEVVDRGHDTVDKGSRATVSRIIVPLCWKKSSVMPLTHNNNTNFGVIAGVNFQAGLFDLG
jgi:hypothetical protein